MDLPVKSLCRKDLVACQNSSTRHDTLERMAVRSGSEDSMSVNAIRIVLGFGFFSNLVLPFGVYHSYVEPYVTDYLWGYKMPFAWIGFLVGLLLLAYPRTPLVKKLNVGQLLVLGGIILLASLLAMPLLTNNILNLWHGTDTNAWDVDRETLILWPLILSISSIVTGVVLSRRSWSSRKDL